MQAQKYDEAEPILREALALRIELRGEDHMEVAKSRSRMAEVLLSLRRFDEAEALLLAVLPRFEAESNDQSTQTQEALALLIALYEASGEPERAEPYRARLQAAET